MSSAALPLHLAEALERRAAGSPSATNLWAGALTRLHGAGLSPEHEILFAQEARTPRHLEDLAGFLGKNEAARERCGHLLRTADESIHALAEWLEALSVFRQWLRQSGHRATLDSALGYLECCDASVNSAPNLTDLTSTVQAMLATYGFDG